MIEGTFNNFTNYFNPLSMKSLDLLIPHFMGIISYSSIYGFADSRLSQTAFPANNQSTHF